MAISKELFLSILAMDSYNRGYDEGIDDLGGLGAKIGNATIKTQSATVETSAAVASGFYALAYTIGYGVDGIDSGDTVLSFRGTDNIKDLNPSGPGDLWRGWVFGTGDTDATQRHTIPAQAVPA